MVKFATFERGCGRRVKGGLYAVCGTSPYGKPIEDFLVDAPIPYLGEPFRAPIRYKNDLIMWVGESYYPFCPDFIEETKVYGVSRRVPLDFKMDGLDPFKSRMFFVHSKAVMTPEEPVHCCPKNFENHISGADRCITALYYYVDSKEDIVDGKRLFRREIGSISYTIPRKSDAEVKYTPGIFMSFPLARFEYVLPDSRVIDPRVKAAMEKGARIQIVDEEDATEERDSE